MILLWCSILWPSGGLTTPLPLQVWPSGGLTALPLQVWPSACGLTAHVTAGLFSACMPAVWLEPFSARNLSACVCAGSFPNAQLQHTCLRKFAFLNVQPLCAGLTSMFLHLQGQRAYQHRFVPLQVASVCMPGQVWLKPSSTPWPQCAGSFPNAQLQHTCLHKFT